MKTYLVNCFCSNLMNSGNPAAIVLNFDEDNESKLAYANELHQPVTVYISSLGQKPTLEFYYPDSKMPLCLHGALAAAVILLKDSNMQDIFLITENGENFEVKKDQEDNLQIEVSMSITKSIEINEHEIAKMLNIDLNAFDDNLPLTMASAGSPKLLVPIKALQDHQQLEPNFEKIKQWSIDNHINGIYTYTPLKKNSNYYARGFNPKTGHNEDAATGVAAAVLASVLEKSIIVEQGHALNRPCSIHVTYNNQQSIWVGGKVKISKLLS